MYEASANGLKDTKEVESCRTENRNGYSSDDTESSGYPRMNPAFAEDEPLERGTRRCQQPEDGQSNKCNCSEGPDGLPEAEDELIETHEATPAE